MHADVPSTLLNANAFSLTATVSLDNWLWSKLSSEDEAWLITLRTDWRRSWRQRLLARRRLSEPDSVTGV